MDADTIEKPPARYRRVHPIVGDELGDRLDRLAQQLDRSVSWITRAALQEYLDRHHPAK